MDLSEFYRFLLNTSQEDYEISLDGNDFQGETFLGLGIEKIVKGLELNRQEVRLDDVCSFDY